MESMNSFWQLGDELRGQSRVSEDRKWLLVTSKLAEQTRYKEERKINLDLSKSPADLKLKDKTEFQQDNNSDTVNFNLLNPASKMPEKLSRSYIRNDVYNVNAIYHKGTGNVDVEELSVNNRINRNHNNIEKENPNTKSAVDKRFKSLPAAETLPRNEVLGGYIFVCNNDTMQDDLKRHLFGLPPRYRDSVRAITPGLPLFLYNYTTHQLRGIFEAASFGGSNIDPSAWEDKKCKGESRFPAQVRMGVRKICKALEEDSFRPVLHHYDGPKFRLELSVPETLDLLDLCEEEEGV